MDDDLTEDYASYQDELNARLEKAEIYSPEEESFSLFIWLRSIPDTTRFPDAIDMVACSAYVHQQIHTMRKNVPIEPETPYPAAAACFEGRSNLRNLGKVGDSQIWRGSLAVPIRIGESSSPKGAWSASKILVGAITLNSTHLVNLDEVDARGMTVHVSRLAVLQERDRSRYDEVETVLEGIGRQFLGEGFV
jgi:hypothetical protein